MEKDLYTEKYGIRFRICKNSGIIMFIKRSLEPHVLEAATFFPVVAILGPRQSGKTTLAQQAFPNHTYISLEDFDVRARAKDDPRLFLQSYPSAQGIILDEIQHAPELLSYIQTIVDREKKKGFFIITGSQNFLVTESVTQTLAGRIALLTLFPLSTQELATANVLPPSIEEVTYKGSYPQLYAEQIPVEKLYANYITTYIERDVRTIKNVENLNTFQRFLQLCAGRIGQVVNFSSLASDCGIDSKTAQAWLSVLESSYIIFLLYPYYKTFGRRLIKSPKIFFVDSGIACSLLRIRNAQDLLDHHMRGNLIESYIMSDLFKQYHNRDQKPALYFWRDQAGHEVDCIIEQASKLTAIEIKSGKTIHPKFFEPLAQWHQVTESDAKSYLVYAGDTDQQWREAEVLTWKSAGKLIDKLEE